jgi:hypothetical protein
MGYNDVALEPARPQYADLRMALALQGPGLIRDLLKCGQRLSREHGASK